MRELLDWMIVIITRSFSLTIIIIVLILLLVSVVISLILFPFVLIISGIISIPVSMIKRRFNNETIHNKKFKRRDNSNK